MRTQAGEFYYSKTYQEIFDHIYYLEDPKQFVIEIIGLIGYARKTPGGVDRSNSTEKLKLIKLCAIVAPHLFDTATSMNITLAETILKCQNEKIPRVRKNTTLRNAMREIRIEAVRLELI